MRMIKSMLAFSLLFAVLFASGLMFPAQSSADAVPDISAKDVKQIADEGKESFVGAIFLEWQKRFGKEAPAPDQSCLTLQDAMDSTSAMHQNIMSNPKIKAGQPFEVYTISPDDLLNYTPHIDISSILVATGQWLVPVTFYGKQRGMLTVAYMDDAWQVVNISVSDYTETVNNNARMGIVGDNPPARFVKTYYPNELDFVVTNVDSNGESRALPSSYTIQALGLNTDGADSSGLYDLGYFLSRLANR